MPYLIGTDEAGYGPNLGPLVITATVWHVSDTSVEYDLYQSLGLKAAATDSREPSTTAFAFGDSKQLYKPGGTLAKLERGVLASVFCLPRSRPATWRELLHFCDVDILPQVDELPWYCDYDRPVPVAISTDEAEEVTRQLEFALHQAPIRLVDIRSKILFPARFNEHVERCDSKGVALSEWTLQLVHQAIESVSQEPVFVRCDKHGGRNRYAGVLQHIFSEQLVQVLHESREDSAYCWGQADDHVEIRFTAKGERFLPAALASMVSKYLREVAMAAFNTFWIERVPSLQPTAGYPVDAQRFLSEISDQKKKLGVPDDSIWRRR